MRLTSFVASGQANLLKDSLRCAAPRKDEPQKICNKLILKTNKQGLIAGSHLCPRCGQVIETAIKI